MIRTTCHNVTRTFYPKVSKWTNDFDSEIVRSSYYTVAVNFGSDTSSSVNGIEFQTLSCSANDYIMYPCDLPIQSTDTNKIHSGTDSKVIGTDYVYGQFVNITLRNLVPGKKYVTSFYLVADSAGSISFQSGDDILELDQEIHGKITTT
jgi:hypothetical protein